MTTFAISKSTWPLAIAGVVTVPLATLSLSPSWAANRELATTTPNVVIIVADDQPKGLLDAMPNVASQIQDQGLTVSQGYIPTSQCAPSRASLLTGNNSHTTGVYTVEPGQYGGWRAFHASEGTTLATELDQAGYRTGLYGKYMNWFWKAAPEGYVPAGWDEFVTFHKNDGDAAYYNYQLEGSIEPIAYGGGAENYSTDVLADHATDFIASSPTNEPFFLYFAPWGVHAPYKPAPRHVRTWALEPASAIPALNEKFISDKPAWIRDNPMVDARKQRHILTRQHATARSVDDAVSQIMTALGYRLDNTLVVYLSDNGYMLGAHRILDKNVPHSASTEVPMFLRWDGVLAPGTTTDRITTNTDLTATIAEATGATWPMEGASLLSQSRNGTILEQMDSTDHPAYCGWRNRNFLFVEYTTGEGRELYSYKNDPNELHNGVDEPRYADVVSRLRPKAMDACNPVPPGFSWH